MIKYALATLTAAALAAGTWYVLQDPCDRWKYDLASGEQLRGEWFLNQPGARSAVIPGRITFELMQPIKKGVYSGFVRLGGRRVGCNMTEFPALSGSIGTRLEFTSEMPHDALLGERTTFDLVVQECIPPLASEKLIVHALAKGSGEAQEFLYTRR